MDSSVATCFLGNPCAAPVSSAVSLCHLKHVRRNEHLYHVGDPFRALFQVVRGSFKTLSSTSTGIEQVLDFYIAGDFMGMDAIAGDVYPSTAIALEESEVCAISYRSLNELCASHGDIHSNVHIALSKEIRRKGDITTMLGYTKVEERVAIFLLDLLDRTARAGLGTEQLPLPMKRHDIASFLGISGETLSRELRKLQRLGLIRAHINSVQIVDRAALEALSGSMAEPPLSARAVAACCSA